MVKIHRSLEQNTEPRNRSKQVWPIFDKGAKTIQWKKEALNKWNKTYTYQKLNFNVYLTLMDTEINSKETKDLHVKPNAIKLLAEKKN